MNWLDKIIAANKELIEERVNALNEAVLRVNSMSQRVIKAVKTTIKTIKDAVKTAVVNEDNDLVAWAIQFKEKYANRNTQLNWNA